LERFGKNKGLISNDNPVNEDENEEDTKPEVIKQELEDREIYVNIKTYISDSKYNEMMGD